MTQLPPSDEPHELPEARRHRRGRRGPPGNRPNRRHCRRGPPGSRPNHGHCRRGPPGSRPNTDTADEALPATDQTADTTEPTLPATDQTADTTEPTLPAIDESGFSEESLLAAAAEPAAELVDEPADIAQQGSPLDSNIDDEHNPDAPQHEPSAGADGSGATPPPPGWGAASAQPGAAPPPGGYRPARRLYRSRHDRRIGGVSAGLAEYLNVDPTIVRLVTFLFAFTGIGLVVYLAAWLIVPLRPADHVEPPHAAPIASERTLTLAFGIAALALAFGIVTDSWEVLAIALIGGGIWLLSERTAMPAGLAPSPAGAAPGGYPPAPPASEPMQYAPPRGYEPAAAPPGGHYAPPPAAPQQVRERQPQRITWIVLSLLALLTSIGIAAATGDWWDVSATRFLGIGVIIIGVGVVVGQLRNGGARGLIPLGLLGALLLFPVSAVDGLLDDGIGEANFRPTTIAELQQTYEHGIGQLTVDLSQLDFDGQAETIDIDLGIGELIVIVSDETGGEAVLQATAGEVSHFLPQTNSVLFEDGVNIESGTVSLEGENGTLDLNISVGLGTAELRSVDR